MDKGAEVGTDVLGVDSVAHAGMLLRVWIETAPLEQWAVGSEHCYRVRLAFEAQGIALGRLPLLAYNTPLPADLGGGDRLRVGLLPLSNRPCTEVGIAH